jgi:hypothetical protein
MVDEASTVGVHQQCVSAENRFVLRSVVERTPDGRVARWKDLDELTVLLRRGEALMYGFECGSAAGVRGDVIAVVHEGNVEVLRAWRVDLIGRRFVPTSPGTVWCESLE